MHSIGSRFVVGPIKYTVCRCVCEHFSAWKCYRLGQWWSWIPKSYWHWEDDNEICVLSMFISNEVICIHVGCVYIHVEKLSSLFPGFFKDLHIDQKKKSFSNAVTVTIFEAELCHCCGSISKRCKWFWGSWAMFKVVGEFNLKQN